MGKDDYCAAVKEKEGRGRWGYQQRAKEFSAKIISTVIKKTFCSGGCVEQFRINLSVLVPTTAVTSRIALKRHPRNHGNWAPKRFCPGCQPNLWAYRKLRRPPTLFFEPLSNGRREDKIEIADSSPPPDLSVIRLGACAPTPNPQPPAPGC